MPGSSPGRRPAPPADGVLPSVVGRFSVHRPGDEIFAKVSLKNLLRGRPCPHREFLILALMELASNLVKHAGGGDLLVLNTGAGIALATLDNGPGIINRQLAAVKGYSTVKGSLGVGLYALARHEAYRLEIFASGGNDTPRSGAVVLLVPRLAERRLGAFSSPFDLHGHNGDFVALGAGWLLLGDAAGHGLAAERSAQALVRTFQSWAGLGQGQESFFAEAHECIRQQGLRTAVVALLELEPPGRVWGVGDLSGYRVGPREVVAIHFSPGILGESYSLGQPAGADADATLTVLMTDGVRRSAIGEAFLARLGQEAGAQIAALAVGHFFRNLNDDATVVAVRTQGEPT